MVITVLEANVDEGNWVKLVDSFNIKTKEVPPEIIDTYLVQAQGDNSLWRIITLWKDQASLDAMRASDETPTGVLIFQNAGAKPSLSVYDVIESV